MSDHLRDVMDCLETGGDGVSCEVPNITTVLEIIPFYDVQLTWLSRWNETPINNPVDVSNQAIADNNSHSRGLARLMSGPGPVNGHHRDSQGKPGAHRHGPGRRKLYGGTWQPESVCRGA